MNILSKILSRSYAKRCLPQLFSQRLETRITKSRNFRLIHPFKKSLVECKTSTLQCVQILNHQIYPLPLKEITTATLAFEHFISLIISLLNYIAHMRSQTKDMKPRPSTVGHSNFEKKSNTLRTFVIRVAEDDKKLTYYWQTLSFSIVGKRQPKNRNQI